MKNVIIILIIFFAIRYLRRYLQSGPANRGAGAGPHQANPHSSGLETEDMVQDPVCGSYIPVSSAVTVHENGRTEHFCGTACRDKRLKDR